MASFKALPKRMPEDEISAGSLVEELIDEDDEEELRGRPVGIIEAALLLLSGAALIGLPFLMLSKAARALSIPPPLLLSELN